MQKPAQHAAVVLLLLLFTTGCPGPQKPARSPAQPPVSGERAESRENSGSGAVDWHRWRGPGLNGISPDTNWNPIFPNAGPRQLWKREVGTGFSSVAVAEGRVYTMGNKGKEETIFCFALEDGREIWKHSYPQELHPKYYEGGPSATPTVDGDAVYTLSKMGDLFCLDARTGKVIWSKNISQELGAEIPTWGFASSVLIQGDLALLNVGTFGTAVDKNNGQVVWKTGKDASGYATPVPFEMDGTRAVSIFSANYIVGLKTEDGSMLWRFPWKTDYDVNAADPIVAGNTVFVSSGYGTGCGLIQFAPGKPQLLWSNKSIANHFNGGVLLDGFIYGIDGMAGERNSHLRCLQLQDGSMQWEERILETGSLIASGKHLIILSGKGELIIAEANPGAYKEISRTQAIGGKCWTAPVLSNGRILVRNARGTVVCLDVRN